jgi:copper homeostasis protein
MMIPDQESLEKYPEDKVTIDENRCAQLIAHARPFGCIFHRAFDPIASSPRWTEGIDTLIALGFKGLLTAGGIDPAPENVSHLERMCRYINNRMQLVIGGGLRHHNIAHMASRLSRYTDCSVWLHTASIVRTLVDNGDNDPVPFYALDIDELNAIFKQLGLARTD